jgi:oligopeptide/dipeptide ABC transporter ATP-binding protein
VKPILDVRHLSVNFKTRKGDYTVVQDVSFHVDHGEILGIAGESGCGKSVTSLSILGLLPENGYISAGEILFNESDLVKYTDLALSDIRGNEIAMIFQDPLSSLNPTMSMGDQLIEPYRIHKNYNQSQAEEAALEMLKKVGIPSPEKRMKEYPHQLSGGMRQRVMIAMALSCEPKLLIADEPTTALDVSIQAQILKLMQQLNEEGGTSIMLITHDMGVIAEMCDKALIMYAGKAIEYGPVDNIFFSPLHPYTRGLLASIPSLDQDVEVLPTIEGNVPSPDNMPVGCRFYPRCPDRMDICVQHQPPMLKIGETEVACFLYVSEDFKA